MHDVLRGASWQNAHPEQLQALFSTNGIRENVINVGRLGSAGSLVASVRPERLEEIDPTAKTPP
jgi:hypothetical protein